MSTLSNAVVGSHQIERDDYTVDVAPLLDPKYTDDGAVKLTMQDADRAATYVDKKQWNLFWRESDVLYQSPRTNNVFEGSTVARANVSRFTVAQHTNSLVPNMKNGIFYETPPFVIRPRPSMKQSTARAKTALFSALLDDIDFEEECEAALEDMTTFGTVIIKAAFRRVTNQRPVRRPKKGPIKINLPLGKSVTVHTKESDEIETVMEDYTEEMIEFERCQLGDVLIDPTWNKPNKLHKGAKYVVHVSYPTFDDLIDLSQYKVFDQGGKQIGGYDIPDLDELKNYFYSHDGNASAPTQAQQNLGGQNYAIHHAQPNEEVASADPNLRPMKMLERWDRTYVYSVLVETSTNKGVLVRKEEHGLPFLPFFAANFWNIPNAGYGIGTGRLAGSDQRIDKGLTDIALDILSFSGNPQYLRNRGANVPTQQIRQRLGGIIDVDGKIDEAFRIVELPRVPAEVFPILQDSRDSARRTTGADEAFTQGNTPTKGTTALRTATVGGGIMAANTAKIQGPVGRFVRGVMLPFLELMDYFVKQRMSPSKIREILDDEMEADFDLDLQNFYVGSNKFEVLAGVHLAAKKAMAQALPLLTQIFENPQLIAQLNGMGWMIDAKELVDMYMEVVEWRNTRQLVRRMTAQEMQTFKQMSPGAQKVNAQVATIGARHQAKAAEIDQKGEVDMARDMIGRANDAAAAWDERKWDRQSIDESEFAPT